MSAISIILIVFRQTLNQTTSVKTEEDLVRIIVFFRMKTNHHAKIMQYFQKRKVKG